MTLLKRSGAALALALALVGTSVAQAQISESGAAETPYPDSKAAQRADKRVSAALTIVHQLVAEPRMKELLQKCKGVFIVPAYGRAALGIGANVGSGVLVLRRDDGSWRGPAFYDLGGITLGLQAGAEGGPLAMVLNNDKAVSEFMKKDNFSLSADAGLTIVNWSRGVNAAAGAGDIVAWSSAKGLFGDAIAVGLRDIRFNQGVTNVYYKRALQPQDIAEGKVSNPQAQALLHALSQASTVN